jgi:hypothetical protein
MRPVSVATYDRRALVVLLLMTVALQPISGWLALPALSQLNAGGDTQTIWATYMSTGGPDVAFIGDSRVRQDVDVGRIEKQLTTDAGHRVTVGKIGLSNADAGLVDAAVYRALALPRKPRTVVIAISEFWFNANYQADRTADYWQLSSPPDLGYMWLAFNHDPNRARLLQGWAVPLVAEWPIIAAGIECDVHPNPGCTYAATHIHADHMTQDQYDVVRGYFQNLYLANFSFSRTELDDLTIAARRVRAAGAQLSLVVLPINGIEELNPVLYSDYLTRMRSLASALPAPLTDLHTAVSTSDWSLWVDPSHLDEKGAASLARQLAQVADSA